MNIYQQKLETIIVTASAQLAAITESEMDHKAAPNKWSKKEILGHLIDSAYNNHPRFLLAESLDKWIFQGYDQEEWVRKNQYQQRSAKEILQTWQTANQHIARLIGGLSEKVLTEKKTKHNFHQIGMSEMEEGTPASLSELILDYMSHQEHHLVQILPDYQRMIGV